MIHMSLVRKLALAAAMVLGTAQAYAAFSSHDDATFGSNAIVVDGQTQMEWLRLDATFGMSFDQVASQMDAGETFAGFAIASAADVTTLFKDGNVWAPLSPQGGASALAAGSAFGSLFGRFDTGTSFVSQGMTSMATGPGGFLERAFGVSYRPGATVSSFDDAGYARYDAFDRVGTWLVRTVPPVPEPSTYLLFGLGLLALGVVAPRVRRSRR